MDSFVLYGPGGASPLQIGSWVQVDPGIDFGAAGLLKAQFVDSPFSEGALSFEEVGPRRMVFPLLVGSGPWGSLTLTESLLRNLARPGGYIDVQPEGVASAEAVRFDILSGRWEPAYRAHLQRVARRQGALQLDTSPYGYWPTWIILASVASWGILPLPLGSAPGDAPALLELNYQPTVASAAAATYMTDGVAWGLTRSPSFLPYLRAASWANAGDVRLTYSYDGLVVASSNAFGESARWRHTASSLSWGTLGVYYITPDLEPAYRGRFRAFAVINSDNGGYAAIDTARINSAPAFASAAAQPTNWFYYQNGTGSVTQQEILDMGEVSIPGIASGVVGTSVLRIWARVATHNANATGFIHLGGVFLTPLEPGGVLARGMFVDTEGGTASQGRFHLDPQLALTTLPVADLASQIPMRDIRSQYFGPAPRLAPSSSALVALPFHRIASGVATTIPPGMGNPPKAAISLRAQPRFQFLKGL